MINKFKNNEKFFFKKILKKLNKLKFEFLIRFFFLSLFFTINYQHLFLFRKYNFFRFSVHLTKAKIFTKIGLLKTEVDCSLNFIEYY